MKGVSLKIKFFKFVQNRVKSNGVGWLFSGLAISFHLTWFGRSFHIIGPQYLRVWRHLTLVVLQGLKYEPLLVCVWVVLTRLANIAEIGTGDFFKITPCIVFADSSVNIWFTLINLFSFINSRTLSRGFRKNMIRMNLFAQAWIFFRRADWPWCQIVMPFRIWLMMRLWYSCTRE